MLLDLEDGGETESGKMRRTACRWGMENAIERLVGWDWKMLKNGL